MVRQGQLRAAQESGILHSYITQRQKKVFP